MRIGAFASVSFLVVATVACSSPSTGADGGTGVDAASGPQPIGAPCDPSLPVPCLPTGDECLGVECVGSAVASVCTEYALDAGPTCTGGAASCAKSSDCETGLTCGFPIGGGCGAAGSCIDLPLACEDDASACGAEGTVCGCGGLPVAVVIPGYAIAPTPAAGVSNSGECEPEDGGLPSIDGASGDASGGGAGD